MTVLRWKPLKSSVDEARGITNFLDGIANLVVGLFIILGLSFAAMGGPSGFLIGIPFAASGVIAYIIFKLSYIGIRLLTEMADDTRLQLLALAGEEYDQMVANKQEKVAESTLDEDSQKEIYNKVVEEYNKMPWNNKEPTLINSTIFERKVVLRDDENKKIITMVLYDGLWVRE